MIYKQLTEHRSSIPGATISSSVTCASLIRATRALTASCAPASSAGLLRFRPRFPLPAAACSIAHASLVSPRYPHSPSPSTSLVPLTWSIGEPWLRYLFWSRIDPDPARGHIRQRMFGRHWRASVGAFCSSYQAREHLDRIRLCSDISRNFPSSSLGSDPTMYMKSEVFLPLSAFRQGVSYVGPACNKAKC